MAFEKVCVAFHHFHMSERTHVPRRPYLWQLKFSERVEVEKFSKKETWKSCLVEFPLPSRVKNGVILNLAEPSGHRTKWTEISEIMPPHISPSPPSTESFLKQNVRIFSVEMKIIFHWIFYSPATKSFSKQNCQRENT